MNVVLKEKLATISGIITTKYTEETHLGVLTGLSGLALFQFYYSKFLNRDEHTDTGLDILTQCIDHINNGYHPHLLHRNSRNRLDSGTFKSSWLY